MSRQLTQEQFIIKANQTHNNKYNYSKTIYTKAKNKIIITCPIHGDFEQIASEHMNYKGCPYCSKQQRKNKLTNNTEQFIIKANQIHNHKYNYSKTIYINNITKVIITCPVHGDFEQKPVIHLDNSGCPKCGKEKVKEKLSKKSDLFFKEVNQIHNHKYNYSKTIYINSRTKIIITCPIHGDFKQTPENHKNRQSGCPKCANNQSKYEKEIISFLEEYDISYIERYKDKYEIDIFIPSCNLGIEFHGLYFHSELFKNKTYHQMKYLFFKEKNINLIQIFENEWLYKKDIIKSIILNKLKKNNIIYARKCVIKEIKSNEAKLFCNENHLQGFSAGQYYIGLEYNSKLVCLMIVGKSRFKTNEYEIIRFCNKININVVGGFERLLSYIDKFNIDNLISFIDVRYFDGHGYIKNKFTVEYLTDPNYYYFKRYKLYSRHKFQKHKLKDLLPIFNELLSEHENMLNNGFLRIYDAGNIKVRRIIK